MPNWVSHEIEIDAPEATVRSLCFDGGHLDFRKLIPEPLHLYRGSLSADDERDFRCNWYNWNVENWGTKWNATRSSLVARGDGGCTLRFETAWSVPYPVMVALANSLKVGMRHAYYDEGENFWGHEVWDGESRTRKRQSDPEDVQSLREKFGFADCWKDADDDVEVDDA